MGRDTTARRRKRKPRPTQRRPGSSDLPKKADETYRFLRRAFLRVAFLPPAFFRRAFFFEAFLRAAILGFHPPGWIARCPRAVYVVATLEPNSVLSLET